MTENPNYDPDYCYECSGYGDNYYMDEDKNGELVCMCPECQFSEFWEDEWLGELNDFVFLTREEAEKKLEEMKNGL